MNPFDILARNLPRPADPQSLRESAAASENAGSNAASENADSFNSLLKGLSEQLPASEAPVLGANDLESLEMLPTESASDRAAASISNAVSILLQGIMPNPTPQGASVQSASGNGHDGRAPSQLLLETMLPSDGISEVTNLAPAPRMTVSVGHQETHFKPIIESLDAKLATSTQGSVELSLENEAGDDVLNPPSALTAAERQGVPRDSRPHPAYPVASLGAGEPKPEVPANLAQDYEQAGSPLSEENEVRVEPAQQTAKQDAGTDLPSENLHRIAGAIKAEAQSIADKGSLHQPRGGEAPQTISVKATESALRVLNLQLHPAHLGAVTIKMRLAGESLEMELHVEREETAQLLKTDSEKLASLLRGSGYRPDTISIHVTEAVVQDRTIASRSQTDMQMQGQSFQDGGASHGERFRNQDNPYASGKSEQKEHANDQTALGSRSAGSVYL
ncbi:flagellar hook-length control protein FliK [Microvirga guangxiensis]|uniref:Hook-length control protein FliK n=1 Tax=Microvirga guangxiensis TaxID=549386 RepID=A0A1G5CUU1_9HYPH|nr:flagellar hook-length control protein FliK [Microvirga guangxiensis]SCY06018.1 hook-length control protein FliK [Microvirga guangxiensis]